MADREWRRKTIFTERVRELSRPPGWCLRLTRARRDLLSSSRGVPQKSGIYDLPGAQSDSTAVPGNWEVLASTSMIHPRAPS